MATSAFVLPTGASELANYFGKVVFNENVKLADMKGLPQKVAVFFFFGQK